MDGRGLLESTFAWSCYLYSNLYGAGKNRFNSHRLTASAANASGSLQTALSKLPDHAMSETARFCVLGSQDRVLTFHGKHPSKANSEVVRTILGGSTDKRGVMPFHAS